MGSIGVWQVILVLMIVLIIFGAGKLPKVMGDVAKGVKNFRSGLKDDDDSTSSESTQRIDDAPSVNTTANAAAGTGAAREDRAANG